MDETWNLSPLNPNSVPNQTYTYMAAGAYDHDAPAGTTATERPIGDFGGGLIIGLIVGAIVGAWVRSKMWRD